MPDYASIESVDSLFSERCAAQNLQGNESNGHIVGESVVIKALQRQLRRVAAAHVSVLIVGESGTGKELVAKALHDLSDRRDKPFVTIHCSAITENLMEAELFGYERGSLTGAISSHAGHFERAGDGTLFLDEIAEMPIGAQAKLLRVLESRHFCRVGGNKEQSVCCRIIAATNHDPHRAVAEGNLRSDLLYRLAVFPVHVPPLRSREGDAKLLAEHFLELLNAQEGTSKYFSADSYNLLRVHPWPGNVRELRNAVQRAFIFAEDELDLRSGLVNNVESSQISADMHTVQVTVGTPLHEVERRLIGATLQCCGGNKTKAAAMLGVSLKTLYNRLHDYRRSAIDDGLHLTPRPQDLAEQRT